MEFDEIVRKVGNTKMTKEYTIQIDGVPDGWEPVSGKCVYGCVKNDNRILLEVTLQKTKPSRIVFEETDELLTPGKEGYVLLDGKRIDYILPSQTLSPPHKIWRQVEE